MKRGKILLDRSLINDPVFKNPRLWKVWTWCLMKATHKPIVWRVGTEDVLLKRGQFITGRIEASQELNMPPSTVRNYFDYLACKRGYKYRKLQKSFIKLDIQAHKLYSIITVTYYDELQKFGQPFGQALDTYNTHNNKQDTQLRKMKGTIAEKGEEIKKEEVDADHQRFLNKLKKQSSKKEVQDVKAPGKNPKKGGIKA